METVNLLPTRKSLGYSFNLPKEKSNEKYIEKTIKYVEPEVGDSVSITKKGMGYSTKYTVIAVEKDTNNKLNNLYINDNIENMDSIEIQNSDGEVLNIKIVNGKWTVVDPKEDRIIQFYK